MFFAQQHSIRNLIRLFYVESRPAVVYLSESIMCGCSGLLCVLLEDENSTEMGKTHTDTYRHRGAGKIHKSACLLNLRVFIAVTITEHPSPTK